jgi:hypothetical protein
MKKIKKWCSVFLALIMLIALIPNIPADAAAQESVTMYVSEVFSYSLYGTTIKSVSSSNKSVVTAAKDKDLKFQINMTAKKAGSATIKIKYTGTGNKVNTKSLKVTVKKTAISCKVTGLSNGYAVVQIKNNTKQTFDQAYLNYTMKGADGSTVKSETEVYVSKLVAGKTAYYTVYVGRDAEIDYANSSASISAVSHNPSYTYNVCADNAVKVTAQNQTEDERKVSFTLKVQNTTKNQVDGKYYLLICDANDNIIGVEDFSIYLGKKEVTTNTYETSIYKSSYPEYDHYRFVVNAYSTIKK